MVSEAGKVCKARRSATALCRATRYPWAARIYNVGRIGSGGLHFGPSSETEEFSMRRGISRRDLLRGDPGGRRHPLRPPWALAEKPFANLCDRCGDCLRACPEGILLAGADGFPRVDFARGGCSFCGECVKSCRPRALVFPKDPAQAPWALVAVISETCLSRQGVVCRACGESCPEGAIRFRLKPGGPAEPLLDADCCSGCGCCFRVCPVTAISLQPLSGQECR